MNRFFTSMAFVLLMGGTVQAFHIIGGDITYECLGNGRYRFVMKIYRDCRPQQQAAPLDDMAAIAIYRGMSNLITSLEIPLGSNGFVAPPDLPCLIPPDNLCVEEGTYEWEYTFADWPSALPYLIVYQRCCRNNTIANIATPQQVGATYSIEITPEAQAVCNNSPAFNQFPPTVVCVGNAINFDHSASDAEGDSLVYEFCSPLKGGGQQGVNPPNAVLLASCNGARPNPPCPPPFQQAAFISPYSVGAPMAGRPTVTIDRFTGLIQGLPEVIGQFVVGVCCKEYRNGELIGEIKRDFQFNVADCDPTVFAKIKSDATVGAKSFLINSCGENTIEFVNESESQQFIDAYRWEFDIDGDQLVLNSRNAEVTFPGIGEYRGVMMVNPGLDCGDTAEIFVNLFPSIEADFSFDYDTCIAGPIVFTDMSNTGAERIVSWEWDFGEGGTSQQKHPRYTYPIPGRHPVRLTVTDNNECVAEMEQVLPYFPVPALIIVEPSSFVGCTPGQVFFNNLSVPIDSTYDITWDFGDGNTDGSVSPTHVFEDPGVFSVSVDIVSPIGCSTSASFRNWIEIKQSPEAAFSFVPDLPSNFNPMVTFINHSFNAESYLWQFDILGRTMIENPTFTFPDTGVYFVALIATHENGCKDTTVQQIDVIPRVTYYMPNAFSPNEDGKNDEFRGSGFTEGMQNFELSIWNRWGERIFVTSDPEEGWNGRKDNSGNLIPPGVYIYRVNYVDPRGQPIVLEGFATLVR